jgi:hypothetical protein
MTTLIEQIKARDSCSQLNSIPVCVPRTGRPDRIFLDTNALQYLQDFGEYIFEHYRESEEYFQARKGKSKKGQKADAPRQIMK